VGGTERRVLDAVGEALKKRDTKRTEKSGLGEGRGLKDEHGCMNI